MGGDEGSEFDALPCKPRATKNGSDLGSVLQHEQACCCKIGYFTEMTRTYEQDLFHVSPQNNNLCHNSADTRGLSEMHAATREQDACFPDSLHSRGISGEAESENPRRSPKLSEGRGASGRSSGAPRGCSRRASGCRPQGHEAQGLKGLKQLRALRLRSTLLLNLQRKRFTVSRHPIPPFWYCKHCLDSISNIRDNISKYLQLLVLVSRLLWPKLSPFTFPSEGLHCHEILRLNHHASRLGWHSTGGVADPNSHRALQDAHLSSP